MLRPALIFKVIPLAAGGRGRFGREQAVEDQEGSGYPCPVRGCLAAGDSRAQREVESQRGLLSPCPCVADQRRHTPPGRAGLCRHAGEGEQERRSWTLRWGSGGSPAHPLLEAGQQMKATVDAFP